MVIFWNGFYLCNITEIIGKKLHVTDSKLDKRDPEKIHGLNDKTNIFATDFFHALSMGNELFLSHKKLKINLCK